MDKGLSGVALGPESQNRFPHTRVGVVIKALNEEACIARAIESALRSCGNYSVTVVLADSGSSDRTVEIARGYDVRIVQLADFSEKTCGIGGQLGFQHVDCDYVYILDGDMELFPDFIPKAIAVMEQDAGLVAVGGIVEEHGEGNYEFERRKATNDGMVTGMVVSLDMGGLYRAPAIRAVGYLTNRNLHSYEEKELGLRLRVAGGRMMRLDIPSVRHFGKTASTGVLIASRWKSGHLDGPGELVRAALGKPYLSESLSMFWKLIAVVVSWVWIAAVLLLGGRTTPWLLLIPLAFHAALLLNFFRRSFSFSNAGVAYMNMMILAASFVRGLFRRQVRPDTPVASNVLH